MADPASASPTDRGWLATAPLLTYYGVNGVQRTMNLARSTAAIPRARAEGHLLRLLGEGFVVGRPSHAVMPITGGAARLWQRSFRANTLFNASMGPLSLLIGVTNLDTALRRQGGLSGLGSSTAGRTGILQSVSGVVELTAVGLAASTARSRGARAMLRSAYQHPMLASPVLTGVTASTGSITIANELGLLRFMDRGSRESVGQAMRGAIDDLPETLHRYVRPAL